MKIGRFIKTIIFEPRIIPFIIPKRDVRKEDEPIPIELPKREPALVPLQPQRK